MALRDAWNKVRRDLGKLLLREEGSGYGSDTWVRDADFEGDEALPSGAFVNSTDLGLGGRRGQPDFMLYSAVAPFILWKMRAYPYARMALRDSTDHKKVINPSSFLDILKNPNRFYGQTEMLQTSIMELDCDGNSYWLKERTRAGQVSSIYWIRRETIWPDYALSDSMGEMYYKYTPSAAGSYPVPASDVVHLRFGIDPRDHWLGMSPLRAAITDVTTDEMAQQHTLSLLRNFAAAGTVVSVDGTVDRDTLKEMEKRWHQKLTGKLKGRSIFVNKGLTVHEMSTTPKDMELSLVRYLTEERMAGLSGVPAIVANVGAGLRRATYANYHAAQKAAWENTAIPALGDIAAALSRQLLPDFSSDDGLEVWVDTSGVPALQEDNSKLSERRRAEWRDRLITRAEARSDLGRDVKSEDDVYFDEGQSEELMADAAD